MGGGGGGRCDQEINKCVGRRVRGGMGVRNECMCVMGV